MIVCKNQTIDKILDKSKCANEVRHIACLYDAIEEYKTKTEQRITNHLTEFIAQYKLVGHESMCVLKKEFMLWVDQKVEKDLKVYVRCEYPQVEHILSGQQDVKIRLTVDVLKKNASKYKTLADIGIQVQEPGRSVNSDWYRQWNEVADRMKELECPEIYETHAHYNMRQYDGVRERLLKEMHSFGIKKCIIPSVEAYRRDSHGHLIDCNLLTQSMLDDYEWIRFGFASHPKYLWKDSEWDEQRWDKFEGLLQTDKCVAVGETGLDYSYPDHEKHHKLQEDFFVRFIKLANKYSLPLILHIRQGIDPVTGGFDSAANDDAVKILKSNKAQNGAVCHCFGGDWNLAQQYMECGVTHFGIGGGILRDDASLIDSVRNMPLESIVLETDAPYINTTKFYGPNMSYTLLLVAEKIAKIRNDDVRHIIKSTYRNAEALFGK